MQLEEFAEQIKPYIRKAVLELYEAYMVTSTNDWAWEHFEHAVQRKYLKPSLFLAQIQRNGRGTQNREWHSPADTGVYCSMLYPVQDELFNMRNMQTGFTPIYTEIAGLAAWVVLTSVYPSLKKVLYIQGTNDLFAYNAKVGGILVETRLSANGYLQGVVTGIGINLLKNNDLKILDGRNTAISLQDLLTPEEQTRLLTRKQMGYLVGICTVGLYDMMHEGALLNYQSLLDLIRRPKASVV
jgi:biotin-(acetyl-CoA carboxylase) ligase